MVHLSGIQFDMPDKSKWIGSSVHTLQLVVRKGYKELETCGRSRRDWVATVKQSASEEDMAVRQDQEDGIIES